MQVFDRHLYLKCHSTKDIFLAHFANENPQTIWILYASNIGKLAGNGLKTVRFQVHYVFISHSSESNLYWFPLHVVSGKSHSLTISFSFIHVLSLAFSIIYFDHLRHTSKIYTYKKLYIKNISCILLVKP